MLEVPLLDFSNRDTKDVQLTFLALSLFSKVNFFIKHSVTVGVIMKKKERPMYLHASLY